MVFVSKPHPRFLVLFSSYFSFMFIFVILMLVLFALFLVTIVSLSPRFFMLSSKLCIDALTLS